MSIKSQVELWLKASSLLAIVCCHIVSRTTSLQEVDLERLRRDTRDKIKEGEKQE